MNIRVCNQCQQSLPLNAFGWTGANRKYRKRTCKNCLYNHCGGREKGLRYYAAHKDFILDEDRRLRQQDVVRTIRVDTRSSDRKAGLENDLTREFIAAEVAKGCFYCGESKIRMTLDRIDNNLGHLMTNVVPACIRCNYTRKDMPYEAWLVVAKGMREAREGGLFSGWTGQARRSKAADSILPHLECQGSSVGRARD